MTSTKPAARCQLFVNCRMLLTPPISVMAASRFVTDDLRGSDTCWLAVSRFYTRPIPSAYRPRPTASALTWVVDAAAQKRLVLKRTASVPHGRHAPAPVGGAAAAGLVSAPCSRTSGGHWRTQFVPVLGCGLERNEQLICRWPTPLSRRKARNSGSSTPGLSGLLVDDGRVEIFGRTTVGEDKESYWTGLLKRLMIDPFLGPQYGTWGSRSGCGECVTMSPCWSRWLSGSLLFLFCPSPICWGRARRPNLTSFS
ncbi:hypothetical protein VTK73DRAFT_4342 [Phialemonium thermophilum]|uniref:Uncharacterized protein n=1 Tax=Phialemonium thermophilum TaxID=223376 RepID=A0ABR3VB78_9PEZI